MKKMHLDILNAIEQYATEGIQVVDMEGNYIFCNQAFTQITGIPVSERIGHNVREVQIDGAAAKVLESGHAVYGYINSPREGCIIVSNASPIRDRSGKMIGAISVFNDRSNYIRLENRLREREQEINRIKKTAGETRYATYSFEDLRGNAPAFLRCVDQALRATRNDVSVLITGESGTGKELFAQAIHRDSARGGHPFIRVNCPAIPATLMESELFGYEKGAFTGANKEKPGKFELAQQGSIFLDEIGDLDVSLQVKLLRVLQEHEVERIGGTRPISLNVRVIAATNQDLQEEIRQHKFRQDLYYRLNVIHIKVPALRERRSDIPHLLYYMLAKHGELGPPCTISEQAMSVFTEYHWPGNIRELENVAKRLLIYHLEPVVTKEDALLLLGQPADPLPTAGKTLRQMEMMAIHDALARHGNSLEGKRAAAAELGISLSGLYKKIKEK